MNTEKSYTYDAFISYRHLEPDKTIAIKLHRALESYRVPGKVAKSTGIKKIRRIFRDQDELPTSNDLGSDIIKALTDSRFLIVACSKNTPQSKWCCQEIELFKKLHGTQRILTILIEGEPEDSFPKELRYAEENELVKEIEPLAADIRASSVP